MKSKIKEFSGIYPIMICPNDYSANKKTTSRSQDAPFWSFLKQNSRAIYRYTFQITSKIEKNKRKCILSDNSEKCLFLIVKDWSRVKVLLNWKYENWKLI